MRGFEAAAGIGQLWKNRSLAVLAALALLSGCATVPREDVDPAERTNRKLYNFNDSVDRAVLKPVADTYVKITPAPVRSSVSNFFDNIGYVNVILNDVLQGKVRQGFSDAGRFIVNSTIGIAGLFDVATGMGLPRHDEDFGQTLGKWGSGEGAYLVLPILGPNTVRDSPGLVVSAVTNVLFYVGNAAITVPLSVLGAIDARARAAGGYKFVNEAALDRYVFTREAYLQHRTFLIYDGNPPPTKLYDPEDDEAATAPNDSAAAGASESTAAPAR